MVIAVAAGASRRVLPLVIRGLSCLLYGGRENSSNVKKVRWLAAELGLSYQHIPAGGQFGRNRETDYLAMNPNGLIPCLQDDDLVL